MGRRGHNGRDMTRIGSFLPMIYRRRMGLRVRRNWRRARRFILHNMLHADDPPHRLALGVAIGMFVTFTPTIGFQMAIVVFLAWLMRANKIVGLPVVWISNPATLVPIYWFCYHVGRVIVQSESIDVEWWRGWAQPPVEWVSRVDFYWDRFLDIAWPLWVGGSVVGLVTAYPSYVLVYHMICRYRLRRWGKLTPPDRLDETPNTDSTAA